MMNTTAPTSNERDMNSTTWTVATFEKATSVQPFQNDPAKSGTAAVGLVIPTSASTPSRPYYVPQFSATTSLILNRIKNSKVGVNVDAGQARHGDSTPSPFDQHADEDTKKAWLFQTQSAILDTPKPEPRASPEHLTLPLPMGAAQLPLLNPSLKRKRPSTTEKVDFTQNTIAFPTPPTVESHPQASRSSGVSDSTSSGTEQCVKCQRSDSLPQNPVFQCIQCYRFWHKLCAPAVSHEISALGFICAGCIQKDDDPQGAQSSPGVHKQRHVDRLREKRLAGLPNGVVLPKADLLGFHGGAASNLARTEYFYGKKKTELLNLLSFCDQLKPQLLVDILVSVSKKHPDLPMFDSPDWATQVPSASKPEVGLVSGHRARIHQRPRHGHIIITKPRQRGKTARRPIKTTPTTEIEVGGATYEEEDAMPPTWPKAGEGLYAKLVPEVEDRLFLADENDEEAFSHFMVDRQGRQIVEPI